MTVVALSTPTKRHLVELRQTMMTLERVYDMMSATNTPAPPRSAEQEVDYDLARKRALAAFVAAKIAYDDALGAYVEPVAS